MARLPIIKRIQREDFPDAPDWIDKLTYPINTFFESVYNALNRNLTFDENQAAETKEFTFATLASYVGTAATWDQIKFVRSIKTVPKAVVLLQIFKFGSATYSPIEGDVYLDWTEANGTVTIGLIRGLAASTKYTARVLVF